jgi:ATPase subunit of ABC transporter with duplicated ATPase domains
MPKRHAERNTENNMTTPKPVFKPKPLPEIKEYGPNAIDIIDLTFAYNNAGSALVTDGEVKTILQGLDLTLETGSRCLLIGANGRYG